MSRGRTGLSATGVAYAAAIDQNPSVRAARAAHERARATGTKEEADAAWAAYLAACGADPVVSAARSAWVTSLGPKEPQ